MPKFTPKKKAYPKRADKLNKYLHPGRLTWNLQITHLERKMIFQTSMIMFHFNLQGCRRCRYLISKKMFNPFGFEQKCSQQAKVALHRCVATKSTCCPVAGLGASNHESPDGKKSAGGRDSKHSLYQSGQIIIFHQPGKT